MPFIISRQNRKEYNQRTENTHNCSNNVWELPPKMHGKLCMGKEIHLFAKKQKNIYMQKYIKCIYLPNNFTRWLL